MKLFWVFLDIFICIVGLKPYAKLDILLSVKIFNQFYNCMKLQVKSFSSIDSQRVKLKG